MIATSYTGAAPMHGHGPPSLLGLLLAGVIMAALVLWTIKAGAGRGEDGRLTCALPHRLVLGSYLRMSDGAMVEVTTIYSATEFGFRRLRWSERFTIFLRGRL